MTRGIGEFGPVRDLLPEWIAIVFAFLTQLGDVWFLATLFVGCYLLARQRREPVATVAGVWLAGLATYTGLKAAFGLPRPDQPLLAVEAVPPLLQPFYESTAFATGYGFPSGHAVNTTIAYVGLALVLSTDDRRRALLGAGGVVALVSLSRVILGVHYVVDVVVGVAVGLALLFGALALADRLPVDRPTTTFGLAGCLAIVSVLTSGGYGDVDLALAAALGGLAGWQFVALDGELPVGDGSGPSTAALAERRRLIAAGALACILLVPVLTSAGPLVVAIGLASTVGVATPAARSLVGTLLE